MCPFILALVYLSQSSHYEKRVQRTKPMRSAPSIHMFLLQSWAVGTRETIRHRLKAKQMDVYQIITMCCVQTAFWFRGANVHLRMLHIMPGSAVFGAKAKTGLTARYTLLQYLSIFFFCLRSFYWWPRLLTSEILLYFSLQHPLHTWIITHPSANHGPSCLTSVILRELVFPTWYCRRLTN